MQAVSLLVEKELLTFWVGLDLPSWYQDLGTNILVPRSWYQKKRRAREAEPLGVQGCAGGCKPHARRSGGLEAPQGQQGVWGAAAPSKNVFMDLLVLV